MPPNSINTFLYVPSPNGIDTKDVRSVFMGEPLKLKLSPSMLGRIFDGTGNPIDDLGEIEACVERDINSSSINPVSRKYPRNYIETGNWQK